MKKLLAGVALCSLLGSSSPIFAGDNQLSRLEQLAQERTEMKGFTSAERSVLTESKRLIAERYVLPDLLFYNAGDDLINVVETVNDFGITERDTLIVHGRSPGNVELSTQYLPEDFPVENYKGYYLILLRNGYEYRNFVAEYEYDDEGNLRPLDQRDQIPWDEDPMLSTTLHEIGHIYFESLSPEQKQELVDKFMAVDNITQAFNENPSENLMGHACFHSHFHSILSDGIFDCATGLASEQFSDIFAYHILGHDYKEFDLFFKMKLDAVVGALDKFTPASVYGVHEAE